MQVRVKVCCISSIEEASMAIEAGASALGLVSEMPSGPGTISDDLIAEIAATIPPSVASFLLTCRQQADAIIEQHRHCRTNTLQLVDDVAQGELIKLRHQLPGIGLVQVIHVVDQASVEQALKIAPFVDAILLDSGNPNLPVKELGGTGRTHNWDLSRQICEHSSKPVFLAGGLNADNVAQAVAATQPFGVDLCSSVRHNDQLNSEKLKRFFNAIDNL